MNSYRADLHIHTVLSPCGDLNMSPDNIISEAVRKRLDIIGISDHNSTRHCSLISKLAATKGIFTLMGAEVTTKEEVHCLAFFETLDTLILFQEYLDANLPDIKNDPMIFGDQVQVDENENIIYTEERLLITALKVSLSELESFVHSNDGILIPAHIDRLKNSIYSQLGFLPPDLKADALEVSRKTSPLRFAAGHPEITAFTLISDSDAHYPENIGSVCNIFEINEPSFKEIKMALHGTENRGVKKIW